MKKIIDKLFKLIKGSYYSVDKAIPNSYLINYVIDKFMYMVYGRLLFLTRPKCFIHWTSKIKCKKQLIFGKNMNIDRNCYIDALSTDGILFGQNVSIGKYTVIECTGSLQYLGKGLIVGNDVGLGTKGHYGCAGSVEIGDDTIIGNYVSFHSENHNFDSIEKPIRIQGVNHKGIKIGKNCWIGAKVTILDGSVIGDGCIIAAGAVVIGAFPDNCVIGGVPAKILKYRN
jgi:acetyltransferase-like isoleucine patch superfamily enzyme